MRKPSKNSRPNPSSFTLDEVEELLKTAKYFRVICGQFENEILALKSENKKLKRRIAVLETPPKRGRPFNKKKVSNLAEALGLALGVKPKRSGGRPIKYLNAAEKIAQWDNARAEMAEELGKKSVNDIQLIERILQNDQSLSRARSSALKKELRSVVKQLRDKTGVRMHKRKKAENLRI